MKTFKTLTAAKNEFKRKTGVDFKDARETLSGVRIWDRRKCKWRSKAQKARIKRPFVVCTQMEWLNFE